MSKQFKILLASIVVMSLVAAAVPPKRAAAPDYKVFGPTTLTNGVTSYHTLANYQGDALWFPDAATITAQIKFDETSGAATTTATIQGSNQLDADTPTWVDIASGAAWTADKDTLISITPTFAMYRIKYVQTGTATSTVRTDWIVE